MLEYQSPQGGWPKSTDLSKSPRTPDDIPQPGSGRANSLDNEATTLPLRFLARAVNATGEAKYRDAFEHGIEYLLNAQYPTGGWPQFWPLRDGYYSRITFNDGAMIRAMTVLRDVAKGEPPYDFVDGELRSRAAAAVERGVDCILAAQIEQNGNLTAWCAQYDEETLKPAWGRAYEPPSLSGDESVDIVRFLMSIEEPRPEIIAAIEGATEWFRKVAIHGYRFEEFEDENGERDRRIVADAEAPPLWARFYELVTNRPLFLGRDSVYRYEVVEIELERRAKYDYYGDWAQDLLAEHYSAWSSRHDVASSGGPDGGGI
ncbi:pectate lyase [Pseudobythopirellula maris]|uniref:pectate lyase n=1 Tax=Pseudobythopirellula maris TaxID=2527991 RepID=UPI0018D2F972|nr:pectate lyase [Pseudobythopirellula maris]